MKLDDYLIGIKDCPDELVRQAQPKLTTEFGIYDNYSILFDADFDMIVSNLKNWDFSIEKLLR